NVIIEIPKDAEPVKYEVDKESGAIFVDRVLSTPMRYPCNYGYVPNTLCGDGDPADVLVVLPLPLVPGSVIRCRPVGVLKMTDEAGSDEKLLAVPVAKVFQGYAHVENSDQVSAHWLERIGHFFEHYKALEKGKWVKLEGWGSAEEAQRILVYGIERHAEHARPPAGRPARAGGGRRARAAPGRAHARLLRPEPRRGRPGQRLRRELAIAVEQVDRVGQDRRRLAQQRVGPLLRGLLARRVLGHVALAGLQPVVGGIGQRVERQAQALALLLALLALGRVALALGAALGLVERDILLLALGAELRHVLDPPLEFRVLLDPLG